MHISSIRLLATVMLLCGILAGVMAQQPTTPSIPGGTSTLPDTPGTGTTESTEDTDVTPPPSATPTLPAQAKRTSLMVKRGDKELELRLAYSHFSKSTVFIDGVAMLPILVVGEVSVERSRKDILIASLAGRYGIMDNLEAEVKVPFRYEHDRNAIPEASPPQEVTISGSGVGDIEGNLYYQLPQKREDSIRWIVNAGVKAATGRDLFEINPETEVPIGTGFWSSKVSVTGVKVSDPAAVYWSFGYTYNWLRTDIRIVSEDPRTGDPVVSYVDIKPGNTFDVGGGVAYALNPRLSMNTGLSISFNGASTANDAELANTAITSASLRLGVVWLTGKQIPIDLSVSIGLTDDSPDFTIEARQTYKF